MRSLFTYGRKNLRGSVCFVRPIPAPILEWARGARCTFRKFLESWHYHTHRLDISTLLAPFREVDSGILEVFGDSWDRGVSMPVGSP
jgi:hypothetical protein